MKPRKVLLTIEITTGTPVSELRKACGMNLYQQHGPCVSYECIDQIQVNVIRPAKPLTGHIPTQEGTVGTIVAGGPFTMRVARRKKGRA